MHGWKKAAGIFAAMNLVGCGVGLFLQCGLGSDPIGLLCDGLAHSLGVQFGHASLLYNLVLIVLAAAAARKNLGAGTIVYALCSGYFIDFYSWLLSTLQLSGLPFVLRFGVCLLGECFFSSALALLIYFQLGMNALDALLYRLQTATGIRYAFLRMASDAVYTVTGFLLGGVFGIGTVVAILLTGNLVSRLLKLIQSGRKKLQQNDKKRRGGRDCANTT